MVVSPYAGCFLRLWMVQSYVVLKLRISIRVYVRLIIGMTPSDVFASTNTHTLSPDNLEQYGVTSFGVSVTTLEEVFMKVGEGAEKTLHDQ